MIADQAKCDRPGAQASTHSPLQQFDGHRGIPGGRNWSGNPTFQGAETHALEVVMQVLDMARVPEKLDANEAHYRVPSDRPGLRLFLRHLPPRGTQSGAAEVVLYVHGGTFPSALSIAHRFDGRSWRDE